MFNSLAAKERGVSKLAKELPRSSVMAWQSTAKGDGHPK